MTPRRSFRYVVGVDPGLSTGLSVLAIDPQAQRPVYPHLLYQGGSEEALRLLRGVLASAVASNDLALVAAERYTVTERTGRRSSQPLPLQIIGQVTLLARDYGAKFILQSPSDAKRMISNALLRRVELYTWPSTVGRPDANDVNDATRHALVALATLRASVFGTLLQRYPDALRS